MRTKLEDLPRTEQSRGEPPAGSYPVKRSPAPSTASAAVAKTRPRQTAGPTAAEIGRPPKKKPSRPTTGAAIAGRPTEPVSPGKPDRSSSKNIATTTRPDKRSTPDPLDETPELPEFTPDPPATTPPRAPAVAKPELETPRSKPAEAIAAAPEIEPAPAPPPQTPPPAPASPAGGDSIFSKLATLASTTAMRAGSQALAMEIGSGTAHPGSDNATAGDGFVPFTQLASGNDAGGGSGATPGGSQPTPAAPALAANVSSAEGEMGMSVGDVLDLTRAEDDLPFVEHRPPTPSRSSGAGTGDLVISAVNQTDFDIDSSEMEFSGNVQVKSPRFAMRCDRFIVHLKADGSGMDYGEGIGNVYIRMRENGTPSGHEGFAHRAIYRPEQGKLTLSGWPKIREKHKEHVAATKDTQMVLYTDGRVRTLGRNRTVIRN